MSENEHSAPVGENIDLGHRERIPNVVSNAGLEQTLEARLARKD